MHLTTDCFVMTPEKMIEAIDENTIGGLPLFVTLCHIILLWRKFIFPLGMSMLRIVNMRACRSANCEVCVQVYVPFWEGKPCYLSSAQAALRAKPCMCLFKELSISKQCAWTGEMIQLVREAM